VTAKPREGGDRSAGPGYLASSRPSLLHQQLMIGMFVT
jgi:hypothetical protein